MKINMSKVLKVMAFCAMIGIVFMVGDAMAASNQDASGLSKGSSVFQQASNALLNTFKNVRGIVFIVGAFALVIMAVMALLGKLNWKWLATIAIALAIVALAGSIVDYSTGSATKETIGFATDYGTFN